MSTHTTISNSTGASAARRPRATRATRWLLAPCIALAMTLATAHGAAQEPPSPTPAPPLPELGASANGAEDMKAKLRELMGSVERNLRAIDMQLSDAAAGEATPELRESGLAALLEAGRRSSQQVVNDIDAILELAAKMSQQQQQSQSQQNKSGGKGGSTQQSSTQERPQGAPRPGQREQTPEQGENKDPGQGQQPSSAQDSPSRPPPTPQGSAPQPPSRNGSAVPVVDSKDTWGELPELVREVFHSQGSSDLPVHYRDWIDGYWERLRERPR